MASSQTEDPLAPPGAAEADPAEPLQDPLSKFFDKEADTIASKHAKTLFTRYLVIRPLVSTAQMHRNKSAGSSAAFLSMQAHKA
jgi:hypothetical protein